MAAAPPGATPAAVTNTSNEVPDVGAGVHWKAQPIFQAGAVMVKAGLVQFPWSWVGPSNNRAGGIDVVVVDELDELAVVVVVSLDFPPALVVVVVVDPAVGAEVVVVDPAVGAEVVVDPPTVETVVLVELPPAGGRVYAPPPEVPEPLEPPESEAPTLPLMAIPMRAKATAQRTSCQVFHERFSLRRSEPGAGTSLRLCGRTGPMSTGS
jgi:hypothetical protein